MMDKEKNHSRGGLLSANKKKGATPETQEPSPSLRTRIARRFDRARGMCVCVCGVCCVCVCVCCVCVVCVCCVCVCVCVCSDRNRKDRQPKRQRQRSRETHTHIHRFWWFFFFFVVVGCREIALGTGDVICEAKARFSSCPSRSATNAALCRLMRLLWIPA